MITTATTAPESIREAERLLLRRTGKEATILVRKVAGEEELARLRESLRTPAPPPVADIESVRMELLARLEGPLKEIWPAEGYEMTSYELGLDVEGTVVRVGYKGVQPLDEVAQGILSKALQTRLQVSQLRFLAEYEAPPEVNNRKGAPRRRKQ